MLKVTTYFATNAPKEATKGEIMKVFAKHGKVIDVYTGTKLGRNGQHYAFIRFTGVEDASEMERRMSGTTIRGRTLTVNIAKHERKAPPPAMANSTWKRKTVMNQNKFGGSGMRDHRTFAEVMNPNKGRGNTSLFGEAKTLDHLGHMPKLLTSGKKMQMTIKYIGGMNVLLEFGSSLDAKAFLTDGDRWKDHLRWLQWGEHTNYRHGRVAWIRLVGLPLNLWGERNFKAITKKFGKTIAPFDKINHRVCYGSGS
ncbi:hypothetical protein LXL04_006656 [Taraxacum kok-saghyz]